MSIVCLFYWMMAHWVSEHRGVCTQLISRNQPQIWAWANLVSAAAEKGLMTQGQPSLNARHRIWVSCWNPAGALGALTSPCPPAAGDAVREGKKTSPSFLLIPVVQYFHLGQGSSSVWGWSDLQGLVMEHKMLFTCSKQRNPLARERWECLRHPLLVHTDKLHSEARSVCAINQACSEARIIWKDDHL